MSQQSVQWKGVFTPLVTPFTASGDVDADALGQLIDLLIEEGVSGLIVAGTTGEFYSMERDEKVALFAQVKSLVAGRVPLLAGTAAIGTRLTIDLTEQAKKLGLDGSLLLPPAFCMPTQREIIQYYRDVAEVGLPIMAYNNPARTGVNLGAPIATELARVENIVAFKETQKDIYAFSDAMRIIGDSMAIFSGLEPYASTQFSRGAVGIVSTISNVSATDVVDLYRGLVAGDAKLVSQAQDRVDRLYALMSKSGLSNFAYVKAAMKVLGRPGGEPRKPHLPADEATIKLIAEGLEKILPVGVEAQA